MTEELWYYELLMDQVGPVPKSQLESLIDDGVLSSSDRIRNAASNDWISVADLPGKQPSDELDINSFTFASSTDLPEPDLDIDQFNLVGDSDLPQSVPKSKPAAAHEPTTTPDNSSQPTNQAARRIQAKLSSQAGSEKVDKPKAAAVPRTRTKKKRRKANEDSLLTEIFEDVFAEDGVNQERPAPQPAPAPIVSEATAQPPYTPASPPPVEAAPSFQNTQPPVTQPPVTRAPRFVPPKKTKPSKSRSFEMPEPQVLAKIGGGLVLILLVGGLTGLIPIFGGDIDVDEFLRKVIREYPAAYEAKEEGWNAFKSQYFETSSQLVEQVSNDPNAGRMKAAAGHAKKLLATSWGAKDEIPETFEKLRKSYFGG